MALPSEDDLHVILTGDLTSGGAASEFAAATKYLYQRVPVSPTDPGLFGLGISKQRIAVIAGNHDHWNDQSWPSVPAFNALIYPENFDEPPWFLDWNTRGAFSVEIYAIDSSGGLEEKSHNHNANGRFSPKDLRRLDRMMAEQHLPPGRRRVRIVMCHHSLVYNSGEGIVPGLYDATVGANRLDEYSRDRLLEICHRHSVGIVLTGHIHRSVEPFLHSRRTSLLRLGDYEVRESIATTAVQDPADSEPQGFWVNRIMLANGGLQWTTIHWKWMRNLARYVKGSTLGPFPLP